MVKTYSYSTIGKCICTPQFIFHVEGDTLVELEMPRRGCDGNLKGIAALVKGMKIDDIIERCDGITCGPRASSCPGQIAEGLKAYKQAVAMGEI